MSVSDSSRFTGKASVVSPWTSPVPERRWFGARVDFPGLQAFESFENFKRAQMSELYASLEDHERVTLARLLNRGQKVEIEVFIRGHGANPIFDPHQDLDLPVGVAEADVVSLSEPASVEAAASILQG